MIKDSNINGKGVFAKTFIPKNKKISDYIGVEMTLKEFKERYDNYKDNCKNTYRLRRINKIIVAKDFPNNITNFVNESLTPNCLLKNRALYTLRDIEPNEELFLKYPIDYHREYML